MKQDEFDNLDDNLEDGLDNLDNLDNLDDLDILEDGSLDVEDLETTITEVEEEELDDVDIMFRFNTNNHKLEGKHSLKRDTIFKGKIEEASDQADEYFNIQDEININDGLPIEVGTNYEYESKHNEDYISKLNLSRDVYRLLSEKTELDFTSNRRKPNRQAFNDYYKMLLDNIGKEYTKSEIFVELAYYFTDNMFNMFKLLDKEYATQIIIELKESGYLNNLNNINFI